MERYIFRHGGQGRTRRGGGIKITPEAFEALAEVINETGMSARQAASIIITQAVNNDLIVYDREE